MTETYTEGLAPSQNAVAENHVKWLKCRARALLQDARLDKSYWPCAMKQACLLHNKRVMGQKVPGIRFGSKVWVRSKEEHLGPFDKRWVEGVFLGPAEDVREGFVIKLHDGTWFRTLHMRKAVNVLDENEGVDTGDFEAVDPPPTRRVTGKTRMTNQEEEFIEEPPQPTTRITSKRSLDGPVLRRAAGQPSGERRRLVEEILKSEIWDAKEAKAKRPQLQGSPDIEQRYVTFGAFQHGGIVNVTNATIEFTEVAEKAAKLVQMDFPGEIFTSVTLTKNAVMPLRRDIFNLKGSFNLVSPLKVGRGSAIWQEMKFGDEFYGNFEFREVDGKDMPGQKMSVERPVKVIPQRWHQPIPGEGPDRMLAVGHTIGSWAKLSSEVREQLEMIGFVVPREDVKVAAMVVECEDGEVFSVDVTSGSSGEAAPNPNTAAPNPDTAGPNPDTAGPNPDTAGPNPDAAGSNPDTAGPNPDTAGPNPDTAGPNPDTAGSNPDTAVSGFGVAIPQVTGVHQSESTLANPGVPEDRVEWIQQMAYLTQQGFTSSSSGPASSLRTISTFESQPRPRVPLPDPELNAYFLDPSRSQGQQQQPSSSSTTRDQGNPVTGGQREDCMVVPGGRVNMKLAWEMQYIPDNQSVPVRLAEEPMFPLEADEKAGARRRLEWLTELMKEELDIETKREQDGLEFDHRHAEMLEKLEDVVDFYRNRLRQDERANREATISKLVVDPGVALCKATNEDLYTENVEELLENLKGPLTVTHTVELAEVKKHLAKWIPSLEKEIGNLEGNGTLKRIPLAKAKELQDKGELVIVPGKTVHTVKPPDAAKEICAPNEEELDPVWFKRKSRMVICGNFIKNEVEVYAAAANAESVRCALSVAAKKRWLAAISDINQAFTLTPISESDTKYAVLAPKVLVEAGCIPPGTAYLVERLLYGLREAPRLWGGFRDKRFRNAKIKIGGDVFRLIQLETDAAVWKLVKDDPLKTTEEFATIEALALIIVYVDDVMFLGDKEMILVLYAWVTEGVEGEQGGWKCSALEFVHEKPVRYLGMELRCKMEGKFTFFHASQGGYIEDLLREYQVEEGAVLKVPATRDTMPVEFNDEGETPDRAPSDELVRLAQKAAGELLWLSTRTRPDLSFAVCHVCSSATKRPEAALKLADLARKYLAGTRTLGLTYVGVSEPVTVYTDASYAPQAGKSHGCIATALFGSFVTWRSAKQPVISLSVAEAELYEVVAGFQQGLSIRSWIEEVIPSIDLRLKVDNTAALGLASTSPGSWRTRHLRVRARFIRQETSEGRLELAHTPGEQQAADLGTKPVPAHRLHQLLQLWRMTSAEEFLAGASAGTTTKIDNEAVLKLLMVLVMCSSMTGTEAKETTQKPPLPVDGSLEFYVSIIVCGIAMLGVWEFLRWLVQKVCCSRDEATILRARRLLRIRDQTARALRQELAELTPEESVDGEQRPHPPSSQGTSVCSPSHPDYIAARGSADPDPAIAGPNDVTEAEARRRNYTFRCLPPPFVMSEHGDRVHVRNDCFGLRNANKAKLRRIPYCTCCAEKYPLYYRTPDGDALLG